MTRLLNMSAWRSMLLFITEPVHDQFFNRLKKINSKDYLRQPEPWFTFGAVEFIDNYINNGKNVFEWGAGSSTLWFASKNCNVVSIEHNLKWAQLIDNRKIKTIQIIKEVGREAYITPQIDFINFSIFIIDGLYREDCANYLVELIVSYKIKKGSIIIYDDTNRHEYMESIQNLSDNCTSVNHYCGISNVVTEKMTSVFIV